MEAKDTVMREDLLGDITVDGRKFWELNNESHSIFSLMKGIAYGQAEISFKAGIEQECNEWLNADTTTQLEKAKQAGYEEAINDKAEFGLSVHEAAILVGRREVVDWLLSEGGFPWSMEEYPERIKKWQAKLAEWEKDNV